MNRHHFTLLCLAFTFVGCFVPVMMTGCKTAPVTGRRQLMVVSEDREVSLGEQSYQQVLSEEPPTQNQHFAEMVNRVGQRIAAVSGRPDYQWEFKVIESPEMNAFCLPGGKVAVYEGILPICQTEGGLAVVMSHEIAHALARHGSERMSHSYAVDSMGKAVSFALQKQQPDMQQKVAQAYGLASKYGVILPYSRKHESEADYIGMLLMARAGYDPREAPRFWERFSQHNEGAKQAEFLSTHPADERRAQDLFEKLPEAIAIYDSEAKERIGMGETLRIASTATRLPETTRPPESGESATSPEQTLSHESTSAAQLRAWDPRSRR